MPKFTVDEIDFNTEDLSETGLIDFKYLQLVRLELKKLNAEIAFYNAAKKDCQLRLKSEVSED